MAETMHFSLEENVFFFLFFILHASWKIEFLDQEGKYETFC